LVPENTQHTTYSASYIPVKFMFRRTSDICCFIQKVAFLRNLGIAAHVTSSYTHDYLPVQAALIDVIRSSRATLNKLSKRLCWMHDNRSFTNRLKMLSANLMEMMRNLKPTISNKTVYSLTLVKLIKNISLMLKHPLVFSYWSHLTCGSQSSTIYVTRRPMSRTLYTP
jgi:hypothetical protein